jgi:hypothetical protein
MPTVWWQDLIQLGIGGAALAVLAWLIGRQQAFQKDLTKEVMDRSDTQQDLILEFFGNHMSKNTETQAELVQATREMTSAVKDLRALGAEQMEKARQWHHDDQLFAEHSEAAVEERHKETMSK